MVDAQTPHKQFGLDGWTLRTRSRENCYLIPLRRNKNGSPWRTWAAKSDPFRGAAKLSRTRKRSKIQKLAEVPQRHTVVPKIAHGCRYFLQQLCDKVACD